MPPGVLALRTLLRGWCEPLGIAAGVAEIVGRDVRSATVAALAEAGRQLGHPSTEPRRRTRKGRPVWSDELVGAIAHDADVAIGMLGPRVFWSGIGVDVEFRLGLPAEDAHAALLQPGERWCLVDADDPTVRFCAKEAAFKAFAGHLDATPAGDLTSIVVDLDDEGFSASHPHVPGTATGRWGTVDDRILTLALISPTVRIDGTAGAG